MSEWISIEKQKPKDDRPVLCWQKERASQIPIVAWYDSDMDAFQIAFTWQEAWIYPSHWMPLPEPPKENHHE